MNGHFKVAQVNTQHSKAVWASLGQAAQGEHLDVEMATEFLNAVRVRPWFF